MHSLLQNWPIETTYERDENIPDTHQPIKITQAKFEELFYNGPQETVWLIVVLKTKRSQQQFFHSDYTMNTMKLLSDHYRGKVRFGYINTPEEENLKWSFGVKTVPQNFLIKDGMVYEMGALQVQFTQIYKFIEGEYLEDGKVWQTFKLPWIIPNWFLPVMYV